MAIADELIFCTPEPRLRPGESAPRAIANAFQSEGAGVLHLATMALKEELDAPLSWTREWGRQFLARLCQTRDPLTVEPPPVEARGSYLAEAPPMRGAEYLSDALLLRIWEEMRAVVAEVAPARKPPPLRRRVHPKRRPGVRSGDSGSLAARRTAPPRRPVLP